MNKITFTGYLHCSKEDAIDRIGMVLDKEDLYVPEEILRKAAWWGEEVSVQCEFDIMTGDVEIVGCEGFLIDKTKKLVEAKEDDV